MKLFRRNNKRPLSEKQIGYHKTFCGAFVDASIGRAGTDPSVPWRGQINLRFLDLENKEVEYTVRFADPREAIRFADSLRETALRQIAQLAEKSKAGDPISYEE